MKLITFPDLTEFGTCEHCWAKSGTYCVRQDGTPADEIHAPRATKWILGIGPKNIIGFDIRVYPHELKGANDRMRIRKIRDGKLNYTLYAKDKRLWFGSPARAIVKDLERDHLALKVQS